ncbi:glycosyltransferase family 2 protein [Alsobacter sp. R-9]
MALLSYVVPAYNAEADIGRCLRSLVEQPGFDAPIIVVDDGSTDGTAKVVAGFGDRVQYVRQDNAGPSVARNRGLALVATEAVCFVDSDDYVVGPHGAVVNRRWSPEFDMLVGHCAEEKPGRLELSLTNKYAPGSDHRTMIKHFMADNCVQTSTIVWSTAFICSIGGWDPEIWGVDDIDLAFRGFAAGARMGFTADPAWVAWYHRPGSVSRVLNKRLADSHVLSLKKLSDLLASMQADEQSWLLYQDRCLRTARHLHLNGFPSQGLTIVRHAQAFGKGHYPGRAWERVVAECFGIPAALRVRHRLGQFHRLLTARGRP